MITEIKEILFSAVVTFYNILDYWPIKLIISVITSIIFSDLAISLYMFLGLMLIDLMAKFMALSHKLRIDTNQNGDFFHTVRGISRARTEHYIRSDIMKNKFGGKIFVYLLASMAAMCVDHNIQSMGYISHLFTPFVWFYFSATEFCSILENFQDAGVADLNGLIAFFKKNPILTYFFKKSGEINERKALEAAQDKPYDKFDELSEDNNQ